MDLLHQQPLFMTQETQPEQPERLVMFPSEHRIAQSLDDQTKFSFTVFGVGKHPIVNLKSGNLNNCLEDTP